MIVDRITDIGAFCSEVDLMWRTDFSQSTNVLWSFIFYICEVQGTLSLSEERS